jgi:glycine dehydrogenase subunit 2
MIEPTETESLATLDAFADAMIAIADEVAADPEKLHQAPLTMPVTRLDEVTAARKPDLRWRPPAAGVPGNRENRRESLPTARSRV